MTYTFFLDIDGTLLWGSRSPTEELISVVTEAQKKGHRFFINTARPTSNIDRKYFPIDIFDGLCSGCGTNIIYRGETIYENILPTEVLFTTVELILKNQPELSLLLEGTNAIYYHGINRNWEGIRNIPYSSVAEIRSLFPGIRIQKFATYDRSFLTNQTAEMISDRFDTYFHKNYTEIVPKGYSKGKAAEIVEKLLCIPHSSTVAIGDSLNDVSMFEYCATSIAMGNAPDEIKVMCDTVTESAAHNGAAKAIARLCDISYQRISTFV
ncbi:MAG: HAD-IIB family hydrolase [Clostridia bacterium]|nr:HAD-IIB family hydrolase [Clostridia bacterium]